MSFPFGSRIIILWLAMPGLALAEHPRHELPSIQTLKTFLEDGIVRQADLDQILAAAKQARLLHSKSPIPDYAHGLVLLKRDELARALDCFEASLKRDPTYLPAWRARLRTRLLRGQTDSFRAECLSLAEIVGDDAMPWESEDRHEAAAWLGRIAGFLSLPEVELMPANSRDYFEWMLTSAFGKSQQSGDANSYYAAGRQTLLEDYEHFKKILKEELDAKLHQQESHLAELEFRRRELEQRAESLERIAEQLKNRLADRREDAARELKTLGKGYDALNQTRWRVLQLMRQTQQDVVRLHLELATRGIFGLEAERQPVMLQLRQELLKYRNQYLVLQWQGANVQTQGRRIVADRADAARRYELVKKRIGHQIETVNRRQQRFQTESEKIQDESQILSETSLQQQLSDASRYLELDEQAELARFIEQAGRQQATLGFSH